MYVGLNLTFASSFQMFRGAVIIFVAFLSMAFLNRRLGPREWGGILFVFLGLCVVGVADFISNDETSKYSRNSIITGDLLIAVAQILTAIQMVYEERYVARLDIPALQGRENVKINKVFQIERPKMIPNEQPDLSINCERAYFAKFQVFFRYRQIFLIFLHFCYLQLLDTKEFSDSSH